MGLMMGDLVPSARLAAEEAEAPRRSSMASEEALQQLLDVAETLRTEQLCAIIEAQAGASAAALRVAEEHAARLVEQPEWVLSEVLLSPDLAPHILAQLPTKEHAVKGTLAG
ncbi:hypothetical protein EMIHUDRAFT_237520 [Emiliania huxleyi CCMP1516]|uniref:Magnesium transporter MgtE intracellular domain-containing protein n=2 Tax=Emiliania huxleyi TaxID=2903 RepID=A0A0D3JPU7_EMIH1|nr:hypothetical protein EMIHUDRAFT_237520 [Emiliania huxleyi CCMP1516]EOD25532.1 hypothetical protein EMIHUDRAFT_237520 [Emiliania huxleyi CCMP1516]|eukprot:XP_005777961.1 hypothetical protein EMIHUDRAFT_237520 [Emiliania huxleyi CCMP1516]